MNQIDQCLKEKVKKVTGLMKDELDGKKIKEFAALRVETYSYLTNNDEDKKAKGTTKCDLKRKPKFEEYDPV